ncbi:HSF-type DNA-binding-domain-containing protein [Blakeslea trispora]|nr:HSF-type DNA-binding-domain-containing protein [Blakeslea trispora]
MSSRTYLSSILQSTVTNQPNTKPNTFVHRLYNMVEDEQFQHLIAWNYTGASFIVCNIMEFSRDVLPKHFKHNNFSSFVRQLNMYGFHKVNKSPRGHRTLAENQIWEFSHSKFLKHHPELLDDIKRKTMESDAVRRETDLQAHLAVLQVSQTDMLQQINHLYDNFNQIYKELHETKQRQQDHQKLVKQCMGYLAHQNGGKIQINQP